MIAFSFSLVGECPGCGKQLDKPGSVLVAGRHEAFVNDDGRLVESEGTDLILQDPQPHVTCTYCNEVLTTDASEEHA